MKELSVPELLIMLVNCEYTKKNQDLGRLEVVNDAIIAQINVALKSKTKPELLEGLRTISLIEPEIGSAFRAMSDILKDVAG
jgi:hypothetical protein